MSGKSVGVILAGCGYLDGSEITEAVLSLYFLEKAGLKPVCFAPDRDQHHVVDHLRGEPTDEKRNVLTESARIARGQVRPLAEARMAELDALFLPGGFGMAKNLSDLAFKGAECQVDTDLIRLVGEAVAAKKPIGAVCISPAVLAAAFKMSGHRAKVTIGEDEGTAGAIAAFGCEHVNAACPDAVVDEGARVASAAAYMYERPAGSAEVGEGIRKAVEAVARMLA